MLFAYQGSEIIIQALNRKVRVISIHRISFSFVLLVLAFGRSTMLSAEQTASLKLEDILQRLDVNFSLYARRVPSLFCDEHAVSHVEPGPRQGNTITDSVFRLKREEKPDDTEDLVESREIKYLNGRSATSQDMAGPTLLNGAFSGGLAVVSASQISCMNYTLQRTSKSRKNGPYVIRFTTALTPQNNAECLLQEDSKGRVLIDPASMQITHLELVTEHHTIMMNDSDSSRIVGKREISVDYTPVSLSNEEFWMPSSIVMKNTSGSGTFHTITWLLRSTYRNYHKTEVTSRMLYNDQAPTP